MRKNALFGVIIILGVWCLVYVGFELDMWRLGYEIEELQVRRAVLKKQQAMWQVRLSELTDPQKIARRAKDELQLMVPQQGQVVLVSLASNPSTEAEKSSPLRLVRKFSDSLLGLP